MNLISELMIQVEDWDAGLDETSLSNPLVIQGVQSRIRKEAGEAENTGQT